MTINIHSQIGEYCITLDDGQKVYDQIHPELKAGRAVELEFAGTTVHASPFFNAGIGQLLEDIAPADLNRLLVVHNLGPVGVNVLRRVIENAKDYYTNRNIRDAVDNGIAELASGR